MRLPSLFGWMPSVFEKERRSQNNSGLVKDGHGVDDAEEFVPDEEERTEKGAGTRRGAGVKTGTERRVAGREDGSGKTSGGVGGGRGLLGSCGGDVGRGWESVGRRGKSCRSRMLYLFSRWML